MGGNMKADNNQVVSEILYSNISQVADDMINATYKLVEENAKFETIFENQAKRLEGLVKNLKNHALNKAWLTPASRARCQQVASQALELAKFCRQYSAQAHNCANSLIAITEVFEGSRVLTRVIKELCKKLDDKKKR